MEDVVGRGIRQLRAKLGLSRAHLSRFLGVSEATVVRWESDNGVTEPKGLQAVLLQTLTDAARVHPCALIGRIVRSCEVDHRVALQSLLEAGMAERSSVRASPSAPPLASAPPDKYAI